MTKIKKRDWTIASWNINSVRLRKELIGSFLKRTKPDFLALQEIKCLNEQFPVDFFADLGYPHQLLHGQKAYHGVAILSKHPFTQSKRRQFGERKQDPSHARHIYGAFQTASGEIGIHNFYVPAGGGKPDVDNNPKFQHKLRFVKSMEKFFSKKNTKTILVGDLNIAPEENDVWSHDKLKNSIGHSPIEIEHLNQLRTAGKFTDIGRHFIAPNQKLYSWWSYRGGAGWQESNYGWRLDHIWTSPDLIEKVKSYKMKKTYRAKTQPSDHIPILIEITL